MAYRPLHLVAEARRIAAGETTSAALVESCLARAAAVEPWLKSFTWLDPDRARRWAAASRPPDGGSPASRVPRPESTTNSDPGACSRAARNSELLLCGIPLGIKDIIDTAGIPTEHGSALFRGRVPERSAPVVQALEAAGAIVLGKTVTAEMAYFHPGPTRNPWNPARTPGGSSMGSAAAVAAGIVPGAVGTQTNGSVIRPAAFCGVVGFKPSAGRISRTGVLCFSHTLDQLGAFASTVEGVAWLAAAMGGEAMDAWWPGPAADHDGGDERAATAGAAPRAPRLAAVRSGEWGHAEPAMQARFEADVAASAAAGARVEWPSLPAGLDDAVPVHRTIMAAEAAQHIGPLVDGRRDAVSRTLLAFLDEGAGVPAPAYQAALQERARLVEAFTSWAAPFDAILTPPACGEAPGPETTGDPRFCTRWTLVGAPAVVLPTGLGPSRLPLGLQLVGAPGEDRRLLGVAAWVESLLPTLPGERGKRV